MSSTAEKAASSRVLISSTRKPRRLQEDGEVHLSALGVAISSLVTVAEILKNKGLAVEKKIITLLETREDGEDSKGRQKPKMEMILAKSDKFDELMAIEAKEDEARKAKAAAAAEAEAAGDGDAE
ncbi:hypothetical protein NADE_003248 [Nannochloris sp. 'desiccata']|nr:hypothetical protein KSW81_000711 [Chlorella desiccata (nom. nud.)]KAH7620634.1 hypothetical protein NADE_003248 [Chlorella desiccata (nom. nud.)]